MSQWCDSIDNNIIYRGSGLSPRRVQNLKPSSMAQKNTRTADSSSATADLLDAIKSLDNIECGEEARKHFNFASSYRNLNHGMFSLMHIASKTIDLGLHVLAISQLTSFVRIVRYLSHRSQICPPSLPGPIRRAPRCVHPIHLSQDA